MQTKVYYTTRPDRLKYCALPDGTADVWLRKNVQEEQDEDGATWTANEVFINTRLGMETVNANFDELFDAGSTEPAAEYTAAERLDVLEAVVAELLEVLV